ncbi:beta-L-arabinofuranosidase domain-containing protein [Segatella copri]|uniref:beta-L-arabinofuranosidase domain-containing protein n=1 Tax=Segatella copri TaxID=165179 RepID=UPI003CFC2AB3
MDLKQFTLLIGVASLPSLVTAATVYRTISKVTAVAVDCPEGTTPRLPNLVWVTYSDGYSEYRQVRWANAPLADEQAEADAQKHPAGSQYEVGGFVIGDETTDNGYPVKAQIKVVAEGYQTPEKEVAHTFSLADVSIDGDNRLTHNRDEALREICSWDVTQQLYNYRDTYGLSTEGYTKSDGWDSPDTKLKGHGSGHYMSAIAQAYAVATNPEQKAILRKNITRMVNELRECQEKTFVYNKELKRNWEARDFAPETELREMKGTWAAFDEYKKHPELYGYGYINAIPAQHCALIEMYRAYNNSDWVWAPYYSVHKQLAGLIDIATYFDDKEICDKALLIAKDMGLWVWNRMHYRTYVKQDGTQDERRAKPGNRYEMWDMYIAGEVGGMSESLARLSEMVSNPDEKAKLLEAANCFDAPKFYDPLSKNIDDIRTRHANQHIPMIIGALRSYKSNQKPYYYNLAENFWRLVQGRYMYAMGGVGNGEMFRQPYTQILSMATNGLQEGESEAYPDINETCCAYNLVKLSKDLNCYNPDNAQYLDYIERTLYNQIIGSLNPDQYQTCYQYAVGLNATKPFGNETPQSTCCGGTGSENHTKYQQSAYFANDNTLWVGLYMPTTLHWKEKGVTIKQDCLWPAQHSAIKITEGEGDFTLKLRVPYWATQGFSIKVNGKEVAKSYQPSTYVELEQKHWKVGDVVEIDMPFSKHIEYGADKLSSDVASLDGTPLKTSWVGTLMYGPLVMAGTGAQTWNQATLNIDSRLSNITVGESNGVTTGAGANLLTLKLDGKEFQPDYYRNANSTHYYRINLTDAKSKKSKKVKIDFTELNSLLNLAAERKADQEKWNALSQKVPEYAPWAPFGYERMQKVMAQAQELVAKGKKKVTQDELEGTTAILNRAINTMRPGNLAEMEDLRELSGLLRRAGWPDDNTSKELKEAISYGRMVQKYVTDGSGTHDMIHAAVGKLKKAMKQ